MLVLTAILSAASAGITMLLLRQVFDLAATGGRSSYAHPLLIGLALMMALLATAATAQVLLARMEGELVEQLRTELSQAFLDVDYEKLLGRKHMVFGAIIEDIARIGPLVLLAPQLAYNGVLALLCFVCLAAVSVPLFGIFTSLMAVTLGGAWLVHSAAGTRFDHMRAAEEKFFEYVRTISEGKKELTLNPSRANHFVEKLLRPTIQEARAQMVRVHLFLGLNSAWSSVTVIGAVFLIVYLGYAVVGLSASTVVQFVVVGLFLVGPLNFIIQTGPGIGRCMASLRHIERTGLDLQAASEPRGPAVASDQPASPTWQKIHAEGLSYRYPAESDAEPALAVGPINLEIRRGELLFIVGGNGSGKSTLLLLLCGLLHPSAGQLRVDGRLVDHELRDYRSRFGGVFGDFFLFEHVLDAHGELLSDAESDDLLRRLALSTQTSVRDGALTKLSLSTGQRKRLALLQCYAEDRDIYFFDEWAADQDVSFRERFYQVLLPELKQRGKTVIVISHDDRYFGVADRIVKLEKGVVVSDSHSAPTPDVIRMASPSRS